MNSEYNNVDEEYCEICGTELDSNGVCWACYEEEFVIHYYDDPED